MQGDVPAAGEKAKWRNEGVCKGSAAHAKRQARARQHKAQGLSAKVLGEGTRQ